MISVAKNPGTGLFTVAGLTDVQVELALLAAGVSPSELWPMLERAEGAADPARRDFGGINVERVDEYIRAHKQIQAIKELRLQTGWGLKESKDWCDIRRDQLGVRPLYS